MYKSTLPKGYTFEYIHFLGINCLLNKDNQIIYKDIHSLTTIKQLLEIIKDYESNGFKTEIRLSICSCTITTPCSYSCTCANGCMSGGCQRCRTYGSLEQRQKAAERIAKIFDDYYNNNKL